jgi:hypothetical protein
MQDKETIIEDKEIFKILLNLPTSLQFIPPVKK